MRHGEHDLHCFNHGDCTGMNDLFRDLRQRVAEIPVSNEDGYRVRSAAIQVLFVKEGFAVVDPRPPRSVVGMASGAQVADKLRTLRDRLQSFDNGRGEGEMFALEIDDLLGECGYGANSTSG